MTVKLQTVSERNFFEEKMTIFVHIGFNCKAVKLQSLQNLMDGVCLILMFSKY